MLDVDLNRYRFDYDLTFAALTLHPDGTVYHRYGGRDPAEANSWLNMPSFIRTLEASLADHTSYLENPAPPKLAAKRTIRDVMPWARRIVKKKLDCVHCHMIHTAERLEAQAAKRWSRDDIWIWPPPERIGLSFDTDEQDRIVAVDERSPAHRAGLRVGDLLQRVGKQRIASVTDLQWVLQKTPWNGGSLPVEYRRGDELTTTQLKLKKGWRKGDPVSFAWRPYKWELRPAPGFGGSNLTPDEIAGAGLPADTHAFRIGYLVDWGEHGALGRHARKAGFRKGDIVLSVAGETFEKESHFQSWFRLTRKIGETVEVRVLRRGEPKRIPLRVRDD